MIASFSLRTPGLVFVNTTKRVMLQGDGGQSTRKHNKGVFFVPLTLSRSHARTHTHNQTIYKCYWKRVANTYLCIKYIWTNILKVTLQFSDK